MSYVYISCRVEVKRVWQTDDSKIQMRWQVRGTPRVPWKAEGIFDGVSMYKLDREGRIFEHYIDNVILRDPPVRSVPLTSSLSVLQPVHCQGMYLRGDDNLHVQVFC